MSRTVPQKELGTGRTHLVAAVDIGSNSIRMTIAQVLPEGRIEVLERLQRAVRLGQDTFRRGRLGAQSMRAAVSILRDYRQKLDSFQVDRIRAVATSAVREAVNADTILDRVFMATGLHVEVIGTAEESRLTVAAVRRVLANAIGSPDQYMLVADVGGGSTQLTMLENGEISISQSLRLGSIRSPEVLGLVDETPERFAQLLRHHVRKVIAAAEGHLQLGRVQLFVAVGGDVRFAAREVGKPTASPDLFAVDADALERLVTKCQQFSVDELTRRYGLPVADAETLNPALLVYEHLLRCTQAKQMLVSLVSMRDGLLLELAQEVTGQEDPALTEGIIHSAMAIAEKYRVDMTHARRVAQLAVHLFDSLQADHGLGRRYRVLLEVAALLHEVGGFVSSQAHHKHSYYLISNTEIFGLTRQETQLVAHIARYHRRSGPKPSHAEYVALPREGRVVVNKLAAILRVADALSRTTLPHPDLLRMERRGDDLVIFVSEPGDLLVEERVLAQKAGLFEDIYGIRIRVEEA